AGLPERECMAMVLRHMKGLSYEEVAGIMNCPVGTVKTYIYKGRKTLRQLLRDSGAWGDGE
ncbi:MAG TPA: sigma factor-like helix-turn-helix DNA-binding protein, partial [Bacillota bacterium]|nr:sigma factor-like helix-turn-helix DNA-binding protein [Bacillota bacterium]